MTTNKTTVTTSLLKKSLFSGMVKASIGITLIVMTGTFLPLPQLQTWGLPIFFASLLLIIIGLVPYKKLSRLQTNPYHLRIEEEKLILLSPKLIPLQTLPIDTMQEISHTTHNHIYGITIILKDGEKHFFPYFSKRSFDELKESIKSLLEECRAT